MNCSFTILGSRLCSPNLKDVACLEDGQLIFYFPSICPLIYVFFFFNGSRVYQRNLQTNVWKIRKINWASSSHAASFKLGEYNLLPSSLMMRFTNWVNFNFWKSFAVGFPSWNIISDRFSRLSRWRRKPCLGLFLQSFLWQSLSMKHGNIFSSLQFPKGTRFLWSVSLVI